MLRTMVQESANNPGTSTTINLGGAATGRRDFVTAFGSGGACFYFMDDGTQAEWGEGSVTAGSPNTLSRTTVIGNTAGTTSRLNFTGVTRVYGEIPAERFGWYKVGGGTVATAASHDITLPAVYSLFRLTLSRLGVSANGFLGLRQSTDGGASYAAGGADYQYTIHGGDGSTAVNVLTNTTSIDVSGTMVSGNFRNLVEVIFDPGTASILSTVMSRASVVTLANLRQIAHVSGQRSAGGRATHIRFVPSGGGTTSFTWVLEGLL